MKLKKRVSKYILINIIPFFAQLFVKFVYLTSKKNFHHPKLDSNENFVIAFWHGDLMMQPFNYHQFKPNGTMRTIGSEHSDGEAIRKVYEHLGSETIKGSSSKGAVKALMSAIKSIKKEKVDVAITPDGPRGPIYSIADGVVAIAQKTNSRIIVFSSIPKSYWKFNSWDKFILPKPFGEIDFYIGEPFSIEGLEIEEAKKLILNKMMVNQLEK